MVDRFLMKSDRSYIANKKIINSLFNIMTKKIEDIYDMKGKKNFV